MILLKRHDRLTGQFSAFAEKLLKIYTALDGKGSSYNDIDCSVDQTLHRLSEASRLAMEAVWLPKIHLHLRGWKGHL
jgi:hypothetical protein